MLKMVDCGFLKLVTHFNKFDNHILDSDWLTVSSAVQV